MLEEADLLIDNGYQYGTAWLREEVPDHVLEWLFSLPGTGDTFDDIRPKDIDMTAFDALINFKTPTLVG